MSSTPLQDQLRSISELTQAFEKETDRGCVLAAAAHLDDQLKELLLAFMADCEEARELLDSTGAQPLSAFGARAKMAYALGLISACHYADLRTIAKLRNDFAHKWRVATFDPDSVMSRVSLLRCFGLLNFGEGVTPPDDMSVPIRHRFVRNALALMLLLSIRIDEVATERRTIRDIDVAFKSS
jgi:DNA-binding MltR family transcriptional regulator